MGAPGEAAEAILDDLPVVPRAIVRTRRRGTMLLWVLAIVGSPIWLALGIGFAAVVLGVYVCIWALAACIWIFAVTFVVVAPILLLLSVWDVTAGIAPYAVTACG